MNGSKITETYQVSHTVTSSDHEAGKFNSVTLGDVVVFNCEKVTTVEEKVVSVEREGVLLVEDTPKKKSKKTDTE